MSSAANHAKRSHRSEKLKGSAFRASARRSYYNQMPQSKRKSIFARLFSRIIKQEKAFKEESK